MTTMDDQEMATGAQYSILSSIPVQDIERVEVLKGPSGTGAYGSQGANGIILLYSKQVNRNAPSKDVYKNFEHIVLPGFQLTRRFYSPFYQVNGTMEQNRFVPTVYWLPDARTDGRGRIRLMLDWQALKGQLLRIEAQGLTPYGAPVSGMLLINVPSEQK
jgi:TonB-dependent SusC/RagA subfamily outer membrane receptor